MKLLLSANFSPNFPNVYQQTPLHLAYRYHRCSTVEPGSKASAVGAKSCGGNDGIQSDGDESMVDTQSGVEENMVAILLAAGARDDLRDDGGKLPIQYCSHISSKATPRSSLTTAHQSSSLTTAHHGSSEATSGKSPPNNKGARESREERGRRGGNRPHRLVLDSGHVDRIVGSEPPT